MSTKTDQDKVIEFLYKNVDFFYAQYETTQQYYSWAHANSKAIKTLSEDLIAAFNTNNSNTFWMEVSQHRKALFALRDGNPEKIRSFLRHNRLMVAAIKKHLHDPIINRWYATQATKEQQAHRKQRERELEEYKKCLENHLKYQTATSKYKEHLKCEIEKEVNKISDKVLLNKLHKFLITNTLPSRKNGKVLSINSQIANALLKQYENVNVEQAIDMRLAHKPKLIDALKKYTIVKQAENILEITGENKLTMQKRIDRYQTHLDLYHTHLNVKKDILTKRRNSESEAFLKKTGVITATLFGVGVGGIVAYQCLFGHKATHGSKFINEVSKIKDEEYVNPSPHQP